MKKLILGLLLIYSISAVEASSNKVYIGHNPAHSTFITNGKPDPGTAEGIMNSIDTDLWKIGSSSECRRPYGMVGSENPKIVAILEREINLSHSIYADPTQRLRRGRMIRATHLLKGSGTLGKSRMTLNARIEDRQGNIIAQAKLSGPKKDFYKLIDRASKLLGEQMCQPEQPKQPEIQPCPYLWNVTFRQSGTLNTNKCFGSGLSEEEAMSPVEGYAYFPNVLIRPSASYELTWAEDDACEYYRKNDIQNNYSAKSKGDIYQKIDGYDGMDLSAAYLKVRNIHKGEKSMVFEFGSVPIAKVLSKISKSKRPEDRKPFQVTSGCKQVFSFTPVPVYMK